MGAQLARDVPFSAICWSTLEPVCSLSHFIFYFFYFEFFIMSIGGLNFGFVKLQIRRKLLGIVGEEGNAASVLGANFSAAFVAGSLAAAATCPLDVAKTRRQIEVSFIISFVMILYHIVTDT